MPRKSKPPMVLRIEGLSTGIVQPTESAKTFSDDLAQGVQIEYSLPEPSRCNERLLARQRIIDERRAQRQADERRNRYANQLKRAIDTLFKPKPTVVAKPERQVIPLTGDWVITLPPKPPKSWRRL